MDYVDGVGLFGMNAENIDPCVGFVPGFSDVIVAN